MNLLVRDNHLRSLSDADLATELVNANAHWLDLVKRRSPSKAQDAAWMRFTLARQEFEQRERTAERTEVEGRRRLGEILEGGK